MGLYGMENGLKAGYGEKMENQMKDRPKLDRGKNGPQKWPGNGENMENCRENPFLGPFFWPFLPVKLGAIFHFVFHFFPISGFHVVFH